MKRERIQMNNQGEEFKNTINSIIDIKLAIFTEKLEKSLLSLIETKLEKISSFINQKFDDMNMKIEDLGQRVSNLEQRMSSAEKRIKSSESDSYHIEKNSEKSDLVNIGNFSFSSSSNKKSIDSKKNIQNKEKFRELKAIIEPENNCNDKEIISTKKEEICEKIQEKNKNEKAKKCQNLHSIKNPFKFNTKNIEKEYKIFFQKKSNFNGRIKKKK